jgi:hypothetical protein
MSHTTIYFLAEAADFDEAERQVSYYLETENFYDNFTVLDDNSGSLSEKRNELMGFINGWDWKKKANEFLSLAEKYKAAGSFDLYGYHLISAGQLYAQYLTIDTYVYNLDSSDYSIPSDDSGWWVIAVDFHY